MRTEDRVLDWNTHRSVSFAHRLIFTRRAAIARHDCGSSKSGDHCKRHKWCKRDAAKSSHCKTGRSLSSVSPLSSSRGECARERAIYVSSGVPFCSFLFQFFRAARRKSSPVSTYFSASGKPAQSSLHSGFIGDCSTIAWRINSKTSSE